MDCRQWEKRREAEWSDRMANNRTGRREEEEWEEENVGVNKKCTVGGGGKKKTEMTGRAENRKQKMEEFGQARLEGSEEEIGSL